MSGGGSRPGERRGGRKPNSPNKLKAEAKRSLTELAQQYTDKALETFNEIMIDQKAPAAARVAAASALLDRGHGKATQPVSHKWDLTKLNDELFAALAVAAGVPTTALESISRRDRAAPTAH